MSDLRVHEVRNLSPEERAVIERLLGHELAEDEIIGVQSNLIVKRAPTGEAREQAARELKAARDALAAQIDPRATPQELDDLIDEARRAVRRER